MENPPQALDAGDRELARITRMARRGFALNRRLVAAPNRKTYLLVRQTENMVDLMRFAMRGYLMRVARNIHNSDHARQIRDYRGAYLIESESRQGEIVSRIAGNEMEAIAGFILTEYASEMDRIVRHTKKIAGLLEIFAAHQGETPP